MVNHIDYPRSLIQASPLQLAAFFLPLFLALTATITLFVKATPFAAVGAFVLIMLLVLQALALLNLATLLLAVVIGWLLISFLKTYKPRLTSRGGVPKLTNIRRVKFK